MSDQDLARNSRHNDSATWFRADHADHLEAHRFFLVHGSDDPVVAIGAHCCFPLIVTF
jgi:hypothetical protein